MKTICKSANQNAVSRARWNRKHFCHDHPRWNDPYEDEEREWWAFVRWRDTALCTELQHGHWSQALLEVAEAARDAAIKKADRLAAISCDAQTNAAIINYCQ